MLIKILAIVTNIRMEKQEDLWIIGGGLLLSPVIEVVRKLKLPTIITDQNEKCVCSKLADIFLPIDIFDIPEHITQANLLLKKGVEIAGVLAAGIDAPETMARLAVHLGLKGVDPDVAHLVHDKKLFREKLRELGHHVPKFIAITEKDIPNIEEKINSIGYPLIVKNTDSSGSRGTKIFRSPDIEGVKEILKVAMSVSRSKTALIEECWEGEEQTVESIFDINGVFHPCFITDRLFDKSSGYAMELGLRQPSSLSPSIQKEMFEIAEKVAKDIGITVGAAKYDMILTPKGPRIIEMTVRLSGGFDCQYLVPAATGKNVIKAAILTALGQSFPDKLLKDSKNRVGLTESLWPKPGKLVAIENLDKVKQIHGVEHIFMRYNIGDVVEEYIDCTKRVCFIIVTGETEATAKIVMEEVKQNFVIKTE